MNTELYMEGYRLDITKEISALLNFAIDDIKDFSSRSTTWSRTIVLPGTANNNKRLGHIFQVGQSNTYNADLPNVNYNFNAAASARVILFQDQLQTFKGVLRLMQINISNGFQGSCEYEVSIFGNLVGLNVALSGRLLENLDFSAYDHVYNDANIVGSWDNPGGSGVYYPLIDYGTYSTNKHDWDIKTFRPGLYVREYIDKMITVAGYRWVGPLLDTPRVKSQVIPHAKKIMTVSLTDLFAAEGAATYYGTPPAFIQNFGTEEHSVPIRFDTTTGTGFTANVGPDKITFTFNGTVTTNIEIRFLFNISSGADNAPPDPNGLGIIDIWKNATFDINGGHTAGTHIHRSTFPGNQTLVVGSGIIINISISPGDKIDFRLSQEGFFAGTMVDVNFITSHFDIKAAGGSTVAVPIQIGDTVKLNENIPQNIRQIDFLVGIVKLYNLYVYEDRFDERLIYITPYIDFYSKNTSNAVDWTHKLNRSKVVKVKPMSELNAKVYKFKFKQDSDFFNELYRKRYNEGYGDRTYDSQFEFTQQEKSFEVIFSATPLVGFGGEDKVYSTIYKRSGNDAAPIEENIDSNIRILQTKKITGVAPWSIKTGATILNTLTRYGYAGHLDDPATPSNDLNFGATKELFFILSAGSLSSNQFNVYWSNYMAEITDKNSKLVTGNFYLTAKDILNLDFSKYIYVDGIAFRLNAIGDYNAMSPDDCIVELFKVNAPSYTEVPSNEGPPEGCYLLWSDEQTLDWNTADALLYGDCNDNPGDGGEDPNPPVVYNLNWSFVKTALAGVFRIYRNSTLIVFSTTNGETSSFTATAGDEILVQVVGSLGKPKRIFVSNDIDGTVNDTTSTLVTHSYTFTILATRNYSVVGEAKNS